MLVPKKTKYRKALCGRIKGLQNIGYTIAFGSFGLKALEPERITARQMKQPERQSIDTFAEQVDYGLECFQMQPVSRKPAEVRMGGKGSVEFYICKSTARKNLFELTGVIEEQAEGAFRLASGKLPIKNKICAANRRRGSFKKKEYGRFANINC